MTKKAPKPLDALVGFKEILEKPVWGPVFWKVLHRKAEKGLSDHWLARFTESVVCPDCREHWESLLERFPREAFKDDAHWAWAMHNMVNTERANKEFYSYEEWNRHRDDLRK